MPIVLDEAAAFGLALIAGAGLTSLAVRAGHRFELFDYPVGWKSHARPTPFTGGIAVVLAFLVAGPALGGELSQLWPLPAMAVALGAVGLVDDRRGLPAKVRVLVEMGAATLLWSEDLGWSVFSSDVLNLALTNLWVVAVINATNLLDLMDGVAGAVAGVAAAGAGALAAIEGASGLAILAFALAGACAGFLVHNLRTPSRIYLGDCGSMAIGFLLAGTITALPLQAGSGWVVLAGAVALVAVPVFDMGLRIVLRLRRGISLLTGGPDSTANWLHSQLGSARRVTIALGATQALTCGLTIGAFELGDEAVVGLAAALLVASLLAGRTIATSSWAREADARARSAAAEELAADGDPVVVVGGGLAGTAPPLMAPPCQGGRS